MPSSSVSAEGAGEPLPPATARVFFALWPPARVADELGRIARQAADRFGGRAIRPEAIHLTLAFLGEVSEDCLPALADAARSVQAAPFDLILDRLGYWRRNQLLWAGCEASPVALDDLHRELQAVLAGAGLPSGHEPRRFKPHITLVRKLPWRGDRAGVADVTPIGPVHWPCGQFALVRSQLSAEGSSYKIIGEFPLSGPLPTAAEQPG